MIFFDSNYRCLCIPQWASFFINLGYLWPSEPHQPRRICLISMPCDSAAAGLVVLGGMRKRLEFKYANDRESHYSRIRNVGPQNGIRAFLRHRMRPGLFFAEIEDDHIWAKKLNDRKNTRFLITLRNCTEWHYEGEPSMEVLCGDQLPYEQHYSAIVEQGGAIQASNLTQSDSSICLAGRVAGEQSIKKVLAGIRFQVNDNIVDLCQLLAIHNWSSNKVSRVAFYNTRTGNFDRSAGQSKLVVVDGDSAFLKVIDRPEFLESDVVCVIHRTIERDKLEGLGAKLSDLAQWYAQDTDLLNIFEAPPLGIRVSILRRR